MDRTGSEEVLAFEGVDFGYPGSPPILKGAVAGFATGGFHLVKGPSGAGKSTLLRLAVRFEEPGRGRILFKGADVRDIRPALLRTRLSYVQQVPVMVRGSVRENLLLPFSFPVNSQLETPSNETLERWLEECSLHGVGLDKDASACSVGQKQRLAIIRALLPEPDCLLLDEPTSGLDEASRTKVETLLERLNEERNVTMVMVSHTGYEPRRCAFTRHELADGGLRRTP